MNFHCVLLLLVIKPLVKADDEYFSGFESASGSDSSSGGTEEQHDQDRVIPKVSDSFLNPRAVTSGIGEEELASSAWVPSSDKHKSAKSKSTVHGLPIKEALRLMTGLKTVKTDEEFSTKLKTGPEHLGVAFKTFEKLSGLWISIMRRIWKVWKGKGARDVMHSIAHSLLNSAGSAVHTKMGNILHGPIKSDLQDSPQEFSGSGASGEQDSRKDVTEDQEHQISQKKEVRLSFSLDDTAEKPTIKQSERDSTAFLRNTFHKAWTKTERNNIKEWINMENENKKDRSAHSSAAEKPGLVTKQESQKVNAKIESQSRNYSYASVKNTTEQSGKHLKTRNIEIDLGDEDISDGLSAIKGKSKEVRKQTNSQALIPASQPRKTDIHHELRGIVGSTHQHDNVSSREGDRERDGTHDPGKFFASKTTSLGQPHQHNHITAPNKDDSSQNTENHTNRTSNTKTFNSKNTSSINKRFLFKTTKGGSANKSNIPTHSKSFITDASSKSLTDQHIANVSGNDSVSDGMEGSSTNVVIKVGETDDVQEHPSADENRATADDTATKKVHENISEGSKNFSAMSNTKKDFQKSHKDSSEISHRYYHKDEEVVSKDLSQKQTKHKDQHKKVMHAYEDGISLKASDANVNHNQQHDFSRDSRTEHLTKEISGSKKAKENPISDLTTKGNGKFKKPLGSRIEGTFGNASKEKPQAYHAANANGNFRTRHSKFSSTHGKVKDDSMKERSKDEGREDIKVDFDSIRTLPKEKNENRSHALIDSMKDYSVKERSKDEGREDIKVDFDSIRTLPKEKYENQSHAPIDQDARVSTAQELAHSKNLLKGNMPRKRIKGQDVKLNSYKKKTSNDANDKKNKGLRKLQSDFSSTSNFSQRILEQRIQAPKKLQIHSSISRANKAKFHRLHKHALTVKTPKGHLSKAQNYKSASRTTVERSNQEDNVEKKQKKTAKIRSRISRRTSDRADFRGHPSNLREDNDGTSVENNSKDGKLDTESRNHLLRVVLDQERSKNGQNKGGSSDILASKVKDSSKHELINTTSKELVSNTKVGSSSVHPKVATPIHTSPPELHKVNRAGQVPHDNLSKRANVEDRPITEERYISGVPRRKKNDELNSRKSTEIERMDIHKSRHGDIASAKHRSSHNQTLKSDKTKAESSIQRTRHSSLLGDDDPPAATTGIENKDMHLLRPEGSQGLYKRLKALSGKTRKVPLSVSEEANSSPLQTEYPQVDLLTSRAPPNSLMTTSNDEHIYHIKELVEGLNDTSSDTTDKQESVKALQSKVVKLESEVTVLEAAMANLAKRIEAQEVKSVSSIQSSHRVTTTASTEELATTHSTEHSHKTTESKPYETTSAKQNARQHGMILIPLASLYNGQLKHGLTTETAKDVDDEPRIAYTTDSSSPTNTAPAHEESVVAPPMLTTELQGPDEQTSLKGPVPRPIVNIIMPGNRDGYYGKAFCLAQCQNGGKCVRGNKCACPTFFVGPQCQKFSLSALFGPSKQLGSRYGGVQDLAGVEPVPDVRSALEKTFRIIGENKADDGIKEDLLLEHGNDMRLAKEAGFESEDIGAGNRRLILEE